MTPIFPELPTKLGIYTLTQMLSMREYSELYLAKQSFVERSVVIEALRPDSPPEVATYFRESWRRRASTALPNVSPVLEAVQMGSIFYLVQELPQGEPLMEMLEQDKRLTISQSVALVQRAAELYQACLDGAVAANAIYADSIYADGELIRFFSPVSTGEYTPEQQAEQMEALADTLEGLLPAKLLARERVKSAIAILRPNAQDDALPEWGQIARKWDALKPRGLKALAAGLRSLKMYAKNLSVKRMMRLIRRRILLLISLPFIIVGVGMTGHFIKIGAPEIEELPAVHDDIVYCEDAHRSYSVMARPVSIGEYAQFLAAWNLMSAAEREKLHEGMPASVGSHEPEDWRAQSRAATYKKEWQGMMLTENSPVCGVSYWDALAYARYAGGRIATAAEVKTARRYTVYMALEEWTSSMAEADFPFSSRYQVYPAAGDELILTIESDLKNLQRTFRITHE